MEHNNKKIKIEENNKYFYISKSNTSFLFSNIIVLINSIFFSK